MTVYLTKVWGFSEPVGPLQFGAEGWRERAQEVLNPGDLVVLVGTKREPTPEAEWGRLLGMMEPTTEPVLWLDFDLPTRPEDFDEQNNYKWPYGLLNRRAWRIIERQPLEAISNRSFNMDAAAGIVPLTDAEASKAMTLRREPARLLEPTIRARARLEGTAAARRMAAPPPATTRRGVMHMRRASAYTYAMQVVGASPLAFKVGWAFDYKARAQQFNQAAMPELGGLQYRPVLNHLWDTAREAYVMEQQLLDYFNALPARGQSDCPRYYL
jgi:hypothetical protein